MSKKFSSFAEQQLITENFRKFINETGPMRLDELSSDRKKKIISDMKDKLKDIGFGEKTEEDFEAAKIEMVEDKLATKEELKPIKFNAITKTPYYPEITEDVGGGGVDFTAIANSIEGLSIGGKEGYAAGLKYISKNGYKPEEGDYQKLVHYANVSNETLAWKNGFKDAAIQWDDFMEDKNIEPGIPSSEHFDDFKKWLGGGEKRENDYLQSMVDADFDELNPTLAETRQDHIDGIKDKIKRLEQELKNLNAYLDKARKGAESDRDKVANRDYHEKDTRALKVRRALKLLKNQLRQLEDAPEGKGNVGRLERGEGSF